MKFIKRIQVEGMEYLCFFNTGNNQYYIFNPNCPQWVYQGDDFDEAVNSLLDSLRGELMKTVAHELVKKDMSEYNNKTVSMVEGHLIASINCSKFDEQE